MVKEEDIKVPIDCFKDTKDKILNRDKKESAIMLYRRFLGVLGNTLTSLIGEVSTSAIFKSAIREASRDFPFLKEIGVEESEIQLECLKNSLHTLDCTTLCSGLLASADAIILLNKGPYRECYNLKT